MTMGHFLDILLTLAVGGVFGIILTLLKIPNGLRIGALFGSALLGIFFQAAWMPSQTKFFVQVIAGSLFACSIERSDVRRLPIVIKPIAIVLGTFLLLNLTMGTLIYMVTPLDLVTSLMCVIPGGASETPIIAADMGADAPKVALVQLCRNLMGIGVYPGMILAYDNFLQKVEARRAIRSGLCGDFSSIAADAASTKKKKKSQVRSAPVLVCTLAVGLAAGFLGRATQIPAGTMLFSMAAVLVLKLKFNFAYITHWEKKIARLLSGCYIGSLITMEDVHSFKLLALPLVITLGGYVANSFITGKIISKTCGFTRKEGLLITAPAGASDMVFSSADIGVDNADVIIVQVFRAIVAAAVFPQIINLLLLVLRT